MEGVLNHMADSTIDALSEKQKLRMICLTHGRHDCPNDWMGALRAARAYEAYIMDGTVLDVARVDNVRAVQGQLSESASFPTKSCQPTRIA
jgi:hypothetical protein